MAADAELAVRLKKKKRKLIQLDGSECEVISSICLTLRQFWHIKYQDKWLTEKEKLI